MDSPPKLSGETLIVHHIPVVHCQVSGGQQGGCASSLKRTNPFSTPKNLGLSRTTSLPERDILHAEVLLYSSLIQTSSGTWASQHRVKRKSGRGGSTASDDSSFTSSNSEEQITAHTLPRAKSRTRPAPRHNPFLLKTEDGEEDEDGDELSGYDEDSSFHLHGDPAPFHSFSAEPFLLHTSAERAQVSQLCSSFDDLELDLEPRHHHSSGSNMSMDCGEQDWADDEEDEDHMMKQGSQHFSCCALSHYSQHFPETFPEPLSVGQTVYGSDSSCNSSDGVLVNFSTIYNKMNNAIPERPPASGDTNLNSQSCPSSVSEPPGNTCNGAFYLDLHTSPTEPTIPQPQAFPLVREPLLSTSSTCSCSAEYQALDLDANCNSYLPQCPGSLGELSSCLQSQARLVVATQNYYKLVTCDLSSQSSPSPAGSTANSSDEQSKGSSSPSQPSQYFLFRQQAKDRSLEEEPHSSHREDEVEAEEQEGAGAVLEGQLYVNVTPPLGARGPVGEVTSSSVDRPRSRSYDRSLDMSQSPGLGSLERMLSCPVKLSEGIAPAHPPPPRVTSFAEIARSKRRPGTLLNSPTSKTSAESFSSTFSTHSSVEFSPILEQNVEVESLSPGAFSKCHSQGTMERSQEGSTDIQAKAQGGGSSPSEFGPVLVRYSKEQRPTTLPIQPFTLQHQFTSRPPHPKPLLPLLTGYMSGVPLHICSHSGSGSGSGGEREEVSHPAEPVPRYQGTVAVPPAGSVRLSPLGSYSPVQFRRVLSSGTCSTCSPSPQPIHSPSCSLSAGLDPQRSPYTAKYDCAPAPVPQTPPPASLDTKRGVVPPTLPTVQGHGFQLPTDSLSPLGYLESAKGTNQSTRTNHAGQLVKLQKAYTDFMPDYFSLTEKPPEEFCLSPDASTSASCFLQPHVSVNLTQKRGLVKAVNTAVDLIVAHFGTTRDPDIKSKLGNSWVSPNVGHLILKYLCPALHDMLQDGLKAYTLDLIIGQRRCQPWSLVEASTQPGPSTRVLHSLFSKVSHYSELTSHNMRFNAFIFGLLNLKSLEFWFNHLYTHEDIIGAHYSPWGFLPLSQGPCHPLFEELLLLLQPLSLLPFDLNLLFEPHLLQKGQEQLRRKELLCFVGHSLHQSERSTFQLMRGWNTTVSDMARSNKPGLRGEGTWHRMETGMSRGVRERGTTELHRGRTISSECGQDSPKEGVPKAHQRQDRHSGWWYQLMQSSQVYIDQSTQGSKFVKTERRRSSERQVPPPREGVVEGAESAYQGEEPGRNSSEAHSGRPSWMGSPPECVLSQDQCTPVDQGPQSRDLSQGQGLRWGRLFGSSFSSLKEGGESKRKAQKSRPPSGWLSLDSSVFNFVAQTITTGIVKRPDLTSSPSESQPTMPLKTKSTQVLQHSACEVRALCHHIATEPGHLSFNKGDVLQVLRKADADWLLCSLGSCQGLVPIVYVTLSGTDSQDASGLGLC